MSPTRINLPGIYNPANQPKEELIANFVVRVKEFNTIFDKIKKDKMDKPPQHYIIQGQRGSGKTTLLLRLFHAVSDEPTLQDVLIPVIFDEEQYGVRTLYKFWEEIANYLEETHIDMFDGLYDEMMTHVDAEDHEEWCYKNLIGRLNSLNKKLVLFIDNFGDMLSKFRRKERQRLREVLIQCEDIRIVGASAVVLEFNYDYSHPFFEFFKVLHLEGLNKKEAESLLLQLEDTYKSDVVKRILHDNPGRVEALRRITSGVPRTIILLFEIFLDSEKGDAFHDLELVLDRVTPLYKHRMDELPPQKQEIVDAIALNWDAMPVKEISKKTRIPGKSISAQLNELEKNNIIKKISTSTKNNFYQIKERFFNIWYLMRNGRRREKQKVLWLVRFLESWCSGEDLIQRAFKHLEGLKKGSMMDKYAYYMSEALASTEIPEELKQDLISTTADYLAQRKSPYLDDLSPTDFQLLQKAMDQYSQGNYEKAIKTFLSIKRKTSQIYSFIGIIYHKKIQNYQKAASYLKKTVELDKEDVKAMRHLGYLYSEELGDLKDAEKYFRMAYEKGDMASGAWLITLNHILNMNKTWSLRQAKQMFKSNNHPDEQLIFTFLYANTLLWNDKIDSAIRVSETYFSELEALVKNREEIWNDIITKITLQLLTFLIAKEQNNYTLKLFKKDKLNLKEKFKPIYYALMVLMKDQFPDEHKKMDKELKQTVDEIIERINKMAIDYA